MTDVAGATPLRTWYVTDKMPGGPAKVVAESMELVDGMLSHPAPSETSPSPPQG